MLIYPKSLGQKFHSLATVFSILSFPRHGQIVLSPSQNSVLLGTAGWFDQMNERSFGT